MFNVKKIFVWFSLVLSSGVIVEKPNKNGNFMIF